MKIEELIAILNLINNAVPAISQLIVLLRDADPQTPIGDILKQIDVQADANLKQISEWFADHPQIQRS